ncbi:MAG: ferrochelatase, partial [Actinomycetaceae bacterium]|nr:ferrochelatase [Actinomycetaceae bacterium]
MSDPLAPYDAVLLVSYGGPEGPDDVLPFMRNATKGAGIPDERLLEVSRHYQLFGGVSPINACNRQLCEQLNERFISDGSRVRIALGNRNWHPYFSETLAEQIRGGARRILTLFTSAYTSYSGCRQYRENLAAALEEVGTQCDISDVVLDRVRPFANTDGFIDANAEQIFAAWEELDDKDGRIVLVTHSIPLSMARASGAQPSLAAPTTPALFEGGIAPALDMSIRDEGALSPEALSALLPTTIDQDVVGEGWTYLAQHLAVGAAIMKKVNEKAGMNIPFDLAFCSRSGPPQAKWLEPDINDHLADLAECGVRSVVTAPIGFLSDHMEVVFDLDTDARQTAEDLGMNYRRAGTAGTVPAMIDQFAQLI